MRKKLFYLFLLLSFGQANAQMSLTQLADESSLIIEGEVVEQTVFRFEENGHLYTSQKIQVNKVFKGEKSNEFIYMTSLGGTLDGQKESWSHSYSFKLADEGLFFLKAAEHPVHRDNADTYEFTGYRKQGYFKFIMGDIQPYASSYSQKKVDIQRELYEPLEAHLNEKATIVAPNSFERKLVQAFAGDGMCAEYLVHNLIIDENNNSDASLSLEFDISLRATEDYFFYSSSDLNFSYSTDVFGENAVGKGNLNVEKSDEIKEPYHLEVSDINESKFNMKINKKPAFTPNGITKLYTHLVHVSFRMSSFNMEALVDIKVEENSGINTYEEIDGQAKELACNIFNEDIIGEVGGFFVAAVTGFTPERLPAGTRQFASILTITGSDFGDTRGNGEVHFKGVENAEWVAPLEGDYLSWSDDEIKVMVPSFAKLPGTSDASASSNDDLVAGTGQIRVKANDELPSPPSADELYVIYAAGNDKVKNADDLFTGQPKFMSHIVPDYSGYEVQFSSDFKSKMTAGGMPQNYTDAFIDGLEKWQCQTGLNFVVNEDVTWTPPWCTNQIGIHIAPNPDPMDFALAGTKAFTDLPTGNCAVPNVDIGADFLECVEMIFNSTQLDNFAADFQMISDVTLHELGHAHFLEHVANAELMNPLFASISTISSDSKDGSKYVQDFSETHTCFNGAYARHSCFPTAVQTIVDDPEEWFTLSSDESNIYIFNKKNIEVEQVSIFDAQGRLLTLENKLNTNGNIVLDQLPVSGMYFLQILDKQEKNYVIKSIKL